MIQSTILLATLAHSGKAKGKFRTGKYCELKIGLKAIEGRLLLTS